MPLFHLDLYRLETPELVLAAGLEEYLHPQGVSVIEWAERWFTKKPTAHSSGAEPLERAVAIAASRAAPLRWVELEVINDTNRRICYEDLSA
jgi:tRNA threonylcarbamoyladenosine biosynthesis protein TsaE